MAKVEDLLNALLINSNDLEQIANDLYSLLVIDVCKGQQLREIAKLVGLKNITVSNTDQLRAFIRGQIGKNTSKGAAAEVLNIWTLISRADNPKILEMYPAEIRLETDVDISTEYVDYILQFMQESVAAGVLVSKIKRTRSNDGWFRFSRNGSFSDASFTDCGLDAGKLDEAIAR